MTDTMSDRTPEDLQSEHPPQREDDTNIISDESEEALLQKLVEYKQVAMRATADYRNLQKESDEKLSNIRKFATEQLLQDLFPLVDYFESAFQAIPADQQQQPWLQGVKHIQNYLLQIMKQYDVERMETVGKPFDPHFHEAVGEEDLPADSTAADHTVVKESQAGFTMHNKVVRHAKVVVGKRTSN